MTIVTSSFISLYKFKPLIIIVGAVTLLGSCFFFQLVLQFCYVIPSVTSLDMTKSGFYLRKRCTKKNQVVLFATINVRL